MKKNPPYFVTKKLRKEMKSEHKSSSPASEELYKWVKANQNLPEFENRDKGYIVRYPSIPDTLEVWKWDWINQRIDNNCDLEILVKVEADQQELWEEIKKDISTADKAHVPLKLIVEWKKRYTLLPNKEPDVQGCDTTEVK